jgi:sugar phosphate isomerase/epimerase
MNRRKFIRNSGLAVASTAFVPQFCQAFSKKSDKDKFGVALFTLPKSLSEDFEGTLKMISSIGYKELEFFGPYSFSTQEAQDSWKQTAGFLGFSGSGYFGHSPKELREILDRHGLSAPSIHIDLPSLQQNMSQIAEAAHIVGHKYVGIAMIPDDMRQSIDDYKRTVDIFNQVGENAKKNGLTFFYHNHGYGHQAKEAVVPFQFILENTDPELVKMQLDVFWFTAAGVDIKKILEDNPGRFSLLHIKDMKEDKRFEGAGENMQEWMGLFPFLADAGAGVLDLEGIMATAKKSGAKHFFLEKDLTPEPKMALQNSYDFLSKISL